MNCAFFFAGQQESIFLAYKTISFALSWGILTLEKFQADNENKEAMYYIVENHPIGNSNRAVKDCLPSANPHF